MKFAIVVFPGSNCDHDAYHATTHVLGQQAELIWHKETDLRGADVVILPGGFAHGDYLRTGAIARFSPVMKSVEAFAAAGGPVIGICNGFQILLEAGLLEGAMLRNRRCSTAASTSTSASSAPTRRARRCASRVRCCAFRSRTARATTSPRPTCSSGSRRTAR